MPGAVEVLPDPDSADETARHGSTDGGSGPEDPEALSILILDDEPLAREALTQCFASGEHRLYAVGAIDEALDRLDRDVVDVAFVDMRLREGSGIDAIPRLLDEAPWLRIVLVTAHGGVDVAVRAIRAGAVDYLSKPFQPQEVRAITEKLAAARRRERRLQQRTASSEDRAGPPALASSDPGMRKVLEMARQVAESDATILITGETGTGKGVLAKAIHFWSHRGSGPFSTINCPSLSSELLKSELFGHVKGAFTGAVRTQPGRIATTEGGTLFLDEVAELPPEIQPRLLRFLQDREYERVGDPRTRQADVRVITATNKDLRQEIAAGNFREDLFYRLNVIELEVPPLRQHPDDILPLAHTFLFRFAQAYNRSVRGFGPEAAKRLRAYPWPGNIRELENSIERAVILCQGAEVGAELLPGPLGEMEEAVTEGESGEMVTLDEMEAKYIRHVLARTDSIDEAARILGVSTTTLWRRRKKYEI
jgi:NtrC-family two-component system response regulator AlgB